MKKIGALLSLAFMACLVLSGCGGGISHSNNQNNTKTLTSIKVTSANSATSVAAGLTLQLAAEGTYSDGTVANLSSQVKWGTTNYLLAKASTSGLLTSYQQGSVTAFATMGTVSGSLAISVTAPTLSTIGITGTGSLAAGLTEQLTAQGTYTDGSTQVISSQVTWQSSDSTVATVNNSGLVISLKAGTVIISASMNSIAANTSVTVSPAVLTAINVGVSLPSLASGFTEQLTATGIYSDNTSQSVTSQVVWQSSDSTVASVSGGLLTALKAGSVSVTATMGSLSGNGNVVVTNPTISSITITPALFTIASGQTKQLSAKGVYSDGTSQDVSSQVVWSAQTTGFATVNSSGLVTGAAAGNSAITATMNSVSGSATATITAAQLTAIHVTPGTGSIATGQTQAFVANGIFSDGSSTDMTDSVVWSSNATNFATMNAAGLATGVGAGATTITATSGSVSGSAALTVTTAVLSEVDISPDAQTIPIGGQVQLTLTGTYSDSTTQTLTNVTWSSSDTTTATVDPVLGLVTGVANSNGNAITITASANGMSDTTTVFVTAAVMESLTLSPASSSIASGTTQQYSASANYSDGSTQTLTSGLSWTSSLPTVAGIDANGVATGITPGQTSITATYGSINGSTDLTISLAVLTAIVVTPALDEVGVNGTVQYTATGVFTDNSTQDLTAQATWSSSASNVALISNSGMATGMALGTTNISATYGGATGSTSLTVATSTLLSITIMPTSPILPPHATLQMVAYGNYSDGSQILLTGAKWSTSSGSNHGWWGWGGYYATISRTGLLRTRRATTTPVQVYATFNGITAKTQLIVTTMTVASLKLTPASPTIAVGTTQPFKLIGTFSDGTTTVDLTHSARWQSSNWRTALIDNTGLAYGWTSGSVTITGSYGGLTPANTTLTVSNATLQSITVNPANPTVVLGALQQFTAAGLFSDGSTQDLTAISHWTSSAPTIAVVNRNGLASSARHGQTDINATFHGVSGFTLLNVN